MKRAQICVVCQQLPLPLFCLVSFGHTVDGDHGNKTSIASLAGKASVQYNTVGKGKVNRPM